MKTAKLITMGCKANQYDTQSMRETLQRNGYRLVDEGMSGQQTDLYLINTCTVTNVADQKARQAIRRAIRQHPNAKVLVTGCYAESDRAAIEKIPGVTFVFGNREKADFQDYLDILNAEMPSAAPTPNPLLSIAPVQHDAIREHARFSKGVSDAGKRTRALIKVQDGCSAFCTYCIIPYVRGRMTSRPLHDIAEEAHRIADSGIKEVVITGVHLGAYGMDTGRDKDIADILEHIHDIEGIKRIRFSSIEPMYFPDTLGARMAALPKCMPHFHLPLQAGSDAVLQRMRRRYTTAEFAHLVENLRRVFSDDVGITTDIMVGFPGETDEHFDESCQFVEDIGFSQLHVFRYSPRKGTPAATYPDQVSPHISAARSQAMIALGERLNTAFRQRMLGKQKEVLIEASREGENNCLAGFTDNYLRVLVDAPESAINQIQRVTLSSLKGDCIAAA
ncbi:tRNA (N(6)-L-threonylcarbamoyladenosine(37)-C(2))-methylthiotransferase MtaB [Candidatus Poribacteria bacterium]|nr:tRNA (N(6)-L-threonylcarbamoyladenosine(37)-C(2))-methylthiotransferase MtaB [Candidatus Poribacteria bacterium]MYG07479.1 tRNA (N(6)-L-threonylcarbamoyladenosine(37)-C(2))-methylthiotransferase MtaB [Candidatus Poribacteria bacterium]MYK21065.1 tRNA (N(6)-L-threonylcarbamoyladenosine(37)-C(2))-methylthiotransferase MtaB [Candidatus Poribacteria bacterium]